jgi:hypothetical protein
MDVFASMLMSTQASDSTHVLLWAFLFEQVNTFPQQCSLEYMSGCSFWGAGESYLKDVWELFESCLRVMWELFESYL